MSAPIIDLDSEETAELRAMRQGILENPALLDNALAELILFRKLRPTIMHTPYLRNAKPVRAIMSRFPGARLHRGEP